MIYDTPASNGLITVNFDQNLAPNVTLVGSYVTGNLNVSMTAYDSDNNIINSIATGGANSAPNGTPNKLLEIMSDRPIRKITFFNGGERGNTFTIDNFYFDSGLNCQISNVPLYKQSGDVDWAEDLYGGSEANPWFDDKGKPGKMKDYGCAVTSAAMIVSYYGLVQNRSTTTPGELNDWLRKQKKGYFGPAINWYDVARFAQEEKSIELYHYTGRGPDDGIVNAYVCNVSPIILNTTTNPYSGHFVVATGILNDTSWSINDPGGFNLSSLGTASYIGYRKFSSVENEPKYLTIAIHPPTLKQANITNAAQASDTSAPFSIIVTDPVGRRTVYDGNTGHYENEILDANFQMETLGKQDGSAPSIETYVFETGAPLDGEYNVTIYSHVKGNYPIDLLGYDSDGNSSSVSTEADVSPGAKIQLQVDYSSASGSKLIVDTSVIYEAYLSVISVDQASHTLPTATPTVPTATPTVPTATPTVLTATSTVPTATPTVPTATPTSTLVASAVLLNTTPSNECEWQVDMQLKGFTPNSQITVSSNYTELVCMTGEIRSDSWSGLYHSNTDANGDLIVSYLHGGTGSYTYSFVDSMGKSASVSFNTSSEIAFVSERDGNAEIYTMRIDGTELSRLTTNSFIDYNPTWSPNGSKIAFHSNRSGKNQIYTMDANGANQIRLLQSTASDEWPYWSPDGARIAFGRVDALDNGGERTEVFVVNSDGTNPTRLTFTTGQTGDSLHGCWPSGWAPNSSEILYYCSLNGNNLSWIMNANGTNQHKLIDGANWNAIPSMSPDGLIISFSTFRDNNYEIYTVNRDGSNLIRLTTIDAEDWRPNWSNNSRFIIFESKREGETQVFMMNRDGSRQRRISSTNDAYNGQPVWRPTN